MGCDGGTIPKRHELVKTRAKSPTPDKIAQAKAKWECCALSKEPLRAPLVGCNLGRLYNKEKVIEFLLNRKAFGDGDILADHITSMKDVIDLNLTPNPESDEKESSTMHGSTRETVKKAQWICPVTMKEMNGKYRFSFLTTCGCVISEQAMKEVPSTTCLRCNKPYDATTDVIPIHTTIPAEIIKLQERVEKLKAEKAAVEAAKKAAKLAKKAAKVAAASGGLVAHAGGLTADDTTKDNLVVNPDDISSRKRKLEQDGDVKATVSATINGSEPSAKKPATATATTAAATTASTKRPSPPTTNSRANINVNMPNLSHLQGSRAVASQSDAIKSLYASSNEDKGKKPKGNFLTMGTFTRYAAY
ncbi:hypothetical protein HDU76_004996 [Blyttiomyces sp. JEL0837]|nr:hypothetical protein HDU76_004996 [Blyttiomyces sp. JEL0837]